MRVLNVSSPKLKKRLDSLARVDGLLAGKIIRGEHGELEYSEAVLDMLKKLDFVTSDQEFQRAASKLADRTQQREVAGACFKS
jgi:hypothetical protein